MSTQTASAAFVVIGRVAAPYGLKGWVKVHSFTQPADNIARYQPLFLAGTGGGEDWQPLVFDRLQPHGQRFIGQVPGCDDRDQAMTLCRRDLACPVDRLPELGRDEYYWRELQGLQVIAHWQGVESVLGDVAWMTTTGANDVMVVRGTERSIDQRERWIPWLADQVVLRVDRAARQVMVAWDPEF